MNSTKPLIKQGARLTNNNYHLFIDIDMNVPKKLYSILYLSTLIALFFYCFRLNQIGEKIDLVYLLLLFQFNCSLEPH